MEMLHKFSKSIVLCVLTGFAVSVWYTVFYFESRENLRMAFLDIGQGDAAFIEVAGNQILIDGGPGDAVLARLGKEMPFWDRSIDLLISTHPDADHMSGLVEVLKRYDVGRVMETGVRRDISFYDEWRRLVEEKKIPRVIASRGMRIDAGRGISIDILAPFDSYDGVRVNETNKTSIVALLRHGGVSALFTGDAPISVERRMLFEYAGILDADILKVGHHGSRTSTSDIFIRALSPDIAVIQAGRNNQYGHPHAEVLKILASAGVRVFRTDTEGTIVIESDGERYWRVGE